jgi:periplasmic divalent cation tolerance protein
MADPDAQASLVVLTTFANVSDARAFIRQAVETGVAACGTILPGATSVYRWDDALTEESEAVVLLKTRREQWDALRRLAADAHPYDVPELLALPVTAGLPAYLTWLRAETIGREEKST